MFTTAMDLSHGWKLHSVLCAQVAGPPDCKLGAVDDLIQGCSAHLQDLSAIAAGSVDLPSTLLLNGWLQRYCFTCATLAVFALNLSECDSLYASAVLASHLCMQSFILVACTSFICCFVLNAAVLRHHVRLLVLSAVQG